MTPQQVVQFAQDNGALMVDFKFMDFVGIWQHFTVPISEFEEDIFEEGLGFDGSSIRGWQPIHASDMIIHRHSDSEPDCKYFRPDHKRSIHPRPEKHRQESGSVSEIIGYR